TGTMPHAEVGVQNDPIHAIVAAAQEILIQSVQPICHGGYARRTPAYFKLPRRGHFFAAQSAKKRSLLPKRERGLRLKATCSLPLADTTPMRKVAVGGALNIRGTARKPDGRHGHAGCWRPPPKDPKI